MHYHAEVWISDKENVQAQITNIMEPHREDEDREGFWDWYQIGGRWKGVHAPDYDPEKDESHLVTCEICNGTGDRPGWVHYENGERKFADSWAEDMNGCNSCRGKGQRMTWPTQWQPHDQDVCPVAELPEGLTCGTLIVGDQLYQQEVWTGHAFEDTDFDGAVQPVLDRLGVTDGYLVTVDYHS